MRIQAIRISNLASITETEVDFTQSPLREAGLFAITGDTGAGKSTLLDAVCLALYGKTARLKNDRGGKISFNGDDIKLNDPRNLLRRGCALGYAEVDFIAQDNHAYKACWQIRRAYNKPGGKLKEPQKALYRLDDGQLVAERKEASDAIERLVGLSFEQFSRAVLLAQHEFAVFLQATGDERAQLLECLTGTDKFSRLGQAIFRRHGEKLDELNRLKAGLDAYELLSDEELEALNVHLAELDSNLNKLKSDIERDKTSLGWYLRQQQLGDAIAAQQSVMANLQQRLEEKGESFEQGQRGLAVQEIRDNRERFAGVCKQIAESRAEEGTLSKVDHQKRIETAQEALVQADKTFKSATVELEKALPAIGKIREIDTDIALLNRGASDTNLQLVEINGKLEQRLAEKQKQTGECLATNTQLSELETWLREHPRAVALAPEWKLAESELTRYIQAQNTLRDEEATLAGLAQKAKAADIEIAALDAQQKSLVQRHGENTRALSKVDGAFNQIDREKLESGLARLQHAEQLMARQSECNAELARLQTVQVQDGNKLLEVEKALVQAQSALTLAESQENQARNALEQVRFRASENISSLRAALVPGQECMVCGSTEHPYGVEHIDQHWQALLGDFNAQLTQASAHATKAREAFAHNQTECELLKAKISQGRHLLGEWQTRLNTVNSQLGEIALAPGTDIAVEREHLLEQKRHLEASLQEKETLRKALDALLAEINKMQAAQSALQQNSQQLALEMAQIEKSRSGHQSTLEELEAALKSRLVQDTWWQQVANSPQTALAEMQSEMTQFEENQTRQSALKQNIESLAQALEHLGTDIARLEQEKAGLDARFAEHQSKLAQAQMQRDALVSRDITADEFQAAHTKAVDSARKAQSDAADALATKRTEAKEQALKLDHLKEKITGLKQEKDALETRFICWLGEFNEKYGVDEGSTCVSADISALLARPVGEFEALAAERETINRELQDVSGRLAQLKEQSAQLANESHPDADEKSLKDRLESLEKELETRQQERMESGGRLHAHQRNLANIASRQDELSALQQGYDNWRVLNVVMGDAEGKKLRNLAQIQTLKILLNYANSHLNILNRRYSLTTIGQSLNIAVIDRDMADEQRSVNTLSGGESFLLSLALALGLASLSSNKVKIESLFIDEGFGTLDSETLAVAMDALDSLQAQGRKVGVISHVPEMAERVATRIHVQKKPGGYSRVEIE